MPTSTIEFRFRNSDGVTLQGEITKTADTPVGGTYPIAASATDAEIQVAIPRGLEMLFILADGALTLKTNDSADPDDTITLVANQPNVWVNGYGDSPVAAAAVVKFYVTNGVATPRTLHIRGLYDASV